MTRRTISDVLARANTTVPELLSLLDQAGDLEVLAVGQVRAGRLDDEVRARARNLSMIEWDDERQKALQSAHHDLTHAAEVVAQAARQIEKVLKRTPLKPMQLRELAPGEVSG